MNGERLYLIDDPDMGIVAETDPEVIARHKRRYEWAAQHVSPNSLVVDAGCGSGYGSTILPKGYIGVDVSEDAVAYALKHYHGPFVVGDLQEAVVMGGAVATVVCLEALEHVDQEEQWAFLYACGGAGVPLVLAVPVRLHPMHEDSRNPHHRHEPAIHELAWALLNAGYTPTITLERYESTYGPAVQALVVARPK